MATMRGNIVVFSAAVVTLMASVLAIAGAFYFQFILHLPPCQLCLIQRWPFYAAIPLSAIAAWLAWPAATSMTTSRILLAIMAIGFVFGAGVAIFHAGVEWKFWEGLESCSGAFGVANDSDAFFQRLQTVQVVRCDEAPWHFAGLSIAGWNALLSLGLTVVTAYAALKGVSFTNRTN